MKEQSGYPCPTCGKDLWWFYGFLACVGLRGHGLFRLKIVPAVETVVPFSWEMKSKDGSSYIVGRPKA